MGILLQSRSPFIGFPSSLHKQCLSVSKFIFPLVVSIIMYFAVYETCYRNRGIDWMFMKRISEIGDIELKIVLFLFPPFSPYLVF